MIKPAIIAKTRPEIESAIQTNMLFLSGVVVAFAVFALRMIVRRRRGKYLFGRRAMPLKPRAVVADHLFRR